MAISAPAAPQHRPYLLILTIVFFLTGCSSLPSRQDLIVTVSPENTENTYLGKKFSGAIKLHSGRSGFIILSDGLEAFAARASMIKLAEKTIDVQYYFIRYDFVGSVFMGLLTEAANRGVRVRILLDDHYLKDKDEKLLAIDGHPNIELRAFNPFRRDTPRFLQFISNFDDISRRMHNKSFTVDNQVTIIGGRNIGAEYFAADEIIEFGDLDVMGIGPIVREVSYSFDSYWNNTLAYTPDVLLKRKPTDAKVLAQANELLSTLSQETEYARALETSIFIEAIRSDSLTFEWAESTLIADSPDKLSVNRSRSDLHLHKEISELIAKAKSEVIIFSPYFIAGEEGSKGLGTLVEKGVKVRIYTNSATSNNVSIVHAHYSNYRKRLLKSGVELFEVRQTAVEGPDKCKGDGVINNSGENVKKLGLATVHAKSFVIDRKVVFVGSFNFDPRSAIENTEVGIVINSDVIGQRFGRWFDENIDCIAYRLNLQNNSVVWLDNSSGQSVISKKEPHTSWWTRSKLKMLGWIPVGGLL